MGGAAAHSISDKFRGELAVIDFFRSVLARCMLRGARLLKPAPKRAQGIKQRNCYAQRSHCKRPRVQQRSVSTGVTATVLWTPCRPAASQEKSLAQPDRHVTGAARHEHLRGEQAHHKISARDSSVLRAGPFCVANVLGPILLGVANSPQEVRPIPVDPGDGGAEAVNERSSRLHLHRLRSRQSPAELLPNLLDGIQIL